MDCLKRTTQQRRTNRTKHVTQCWVFVLFFFFCKSGCHSGAIVSWFAGRGLQVDGQKLAQSTFHGRLVYLCYPCAPAVVDNCSSRIIPKTSIPTVLIHVLCPSRRDPLSFLVVNTPIFQHMPESIKTQCSNWGKHHIILTCFLKFEQETKPFSSVTVMSLKMGIPGLKCI